MSVLCSVYSLNVALGDVCTLFCLFIERCSRWCLYFVLSIHWTLL